MMHELLITLFLDWQLIRARTGVTCGVLRVCDAETRETFLGPLGLANVNLIATLCMTINSRPRASGASGLL
jgi:hypothetical protein